MAKIGTWMKTGAAALAAAAWTMGCETSTLNDEGTLTLEQLQGLASTNAVAAANTNAASTGETPATGTTTNGLWPAEITGPVKFLHADVSGWPVTASLNASVGGTINLPYSKAKVWPAVDGVNANPWVIVNMDGQWYAVTFEWLRHGQTSKPKGVLDGSMGDHIKVPPLNRWRPRSGERIGLMVSGLARTKMRNVQERSNVVMVTWP